MARRGRRPSGANLVDRLSGSGHAKKRTKVILQTLSGHKTIREACEALGMNEAAFHKLRSRFLSEAVESLEPRPVGRKPRRSEAESEEIERLREELEELERELKASRIREQLALAMPQLSMEAKKKRRSRRK